jgi:hypothetical protein
MPKAPKIKIDKGPVAPVVDMPTEAEKVAAPANEIVYPTVGTNGRFAAVAFMDGYVVYNPNGQRVSGIMSKAAADDMVRNQNTAAHIKG